MKTLILKCRFCGKQTGEYKYPDNLTVADLGIADVRCSECELLYGSFTKMSQEYMGLGKTYKDFTTLIKKCDYKKVNFDIEVTKLKDALTPVLGSKLKKSSKYVKIIKKKQ